MSSLTKKEAEVMGFIQSYAKEFFGLTPSIREIKAKIGLKSNLAVVELLIALEAKGFVKRIKYKPIAIVREYAGSEYDTSKDST